MKRTMGAIAAVGLILAGCERPMPMTASVTPKIAGAELRQEIRAITRRAEPARLGVGLMNLESGEVWLRRGDRRFPMQSVFKAVLGAAALAEVDAGRLSLDETIRLTDVDISPPYSPVADAYPERRDYTVAELLTLAVGGSDNTAADVLMKRIGGPGAVTAWLVSRGVKEVRVDRYERQLQTEIAGLASFRIAWKGEAAFMEAMRQVPAIERRAAMAAYLADPQDTATPRGALTFLYKLNAGELLSRDSTRRLLQIITETRSGQARIKAGLPPGARLAHKTGTARTDLGVNPAINDIGIATLPDGRRYAIALFLSGSTADEAEREAILADTTRALVPAMR